MGKGSGTTVGFHYRPAFHSGLGRGPIDAYLEFRGGDRTAWSGELTSSGTISINAPNLFGGEKDQGGIVGDVDVMFGTADQEPNTYLVSAFGPQTVAWRGMATVAFKGGRYGAMSPYPQKASHKIRKIKEGWDEPGCWYPEKAEILMQGRSVVLSPWVDGNDPRNEQNVHEYRRWSIAGDHGLWRTSLAEAISDSFVDGVVEEDFSSQIGWSFDGWKINRVFDISPGDSPSLVLHFNRHSMAQLGWVSVAGDDGLGNRLCTNLAWLGMSPGLDRKYWTGLGLDMLPFPDDGGYIRPGFYRLLPGVWDGDASPPFDPGEWEVNHSCSQWPSGGGYFAAAAVTVDRHIEVRRSSVGDSCLAINPAHAIYYVHTDGEHGRSSRGSINDQSIRSAADLLYAEGFGVCTSIDPSKESPNEFIERIARLIGGSFSRSLSDGQWYLDLARGDYDKDALPVLTDDDILSFNEKPSTLDGAVNSVAVKYFDPERKEEMVTPAVRALGLIRRFGENHMVVECPEIPTASLALRKAEMELRARSTPTRAFELATTRHTFGWRPNQYFRLQSVKRGIADMVCLVGEVGAGTLRSGAITLKASQDIYSLPATTYVEVETGVDTRPSQTPLAIDAQVAFEAPYVELAQRMTRADLSFLPSGAGYLMAAAKDPANSRDFTMVVREAGGEFTRSGNGSWCPTGRVVEVAGLEGGPFTLTDAVGMDRVRIGQAALWGGEICRVDGVAPLLLGRGCADTVPVPHSAGERIWFYDDEFAGDATEYAEGEVVDVRLLTNTGSQQLPVSAAANIVVTFDHRQARPYPPGGVLVNGSPAPAYLSGLLTLGWVHRDRLQQADQLIDHGVAGIGPEAGTTYAVSWYLDGVLQHSESGISGTSAAYTYTADGRARVELESERDGLGSWQRHVREFDYTVTPGVPWELQSGSALQQQNNSIILLMG